MIFTLSDGRRLSYEVFGDPAGFPVLSCHGGLLCRLDASAAGVAARELGVSLVSPDRPGVGFSDRSPGHTTLDWAGDAEALLDHLDVERFARMGWSLGGQYCVAVAFRMPERISRAAIVAGCLPLDEPGHVAEVNRLDRTLVRLRPARGRSLVRRSRSCG